MSERSYVFASRERPTETIATARIQLTIEVDAKSRWSAATSIAQVDTQAIDETREELARLLDLARAHGISMRVVGDPLLVTMMLAARAK